ncbi:uncharacterized protein LOC119980704 [Tripterygium wilfordii]|uniref:uncharacterized protein LOC119980704 n=1 Tax=Tripterygium wilfordii TaxID=458696 RepID=UPI0018F84BE8|nr:uncharacterized protein LOC119980704 [Tripterygium wilfordii]
MAQNQSTEKSTVLPGGDENTTSGLTPIGHVAQDGVTKLTTQGSTALPTNLTGMVGPSGVGVTTPMAPTVGTVDPMTGRVNSVVLGEKPEKFNGTDFKRWEQKMQLYLSTCGLSKYLTEVCPAISADESNPSIAVVVQAWMYGDYLCKNHSLNGLVNSLYGVYCKISTTKKLWEALHKKYKTEDAGIKKFVVSRFYDFKMVDSKFVVAQVEEFQLLMHEIEAEGMNLSEAFLVGTVIEKLPPGWSDYKNRLMHKTKKMNMEDLSLHLRL